MRPTDLPITRLSELFNVNQFIVSQVNPHLVPLLNSRMSPSRGQWPHRVVMALLREMFHWVQQLTAIGWLPGSLAWLRDEVNAQVEGHITIVPYLEWSSLPRALSNPSAEQLQWCISEAERGAFRSVETVRLRCAIERALTEALYTARKNMLPRLAGSLAAAPNHENVPATDPRRLSAHSAHDSPPVHRRRSHSLVLDAAAADHAERGPWILPPRPVINDDASESHPAPGSVAALAAASSHPFINDVATTTAEKLTTSLPSSPVIWRRYARTPSPPPPPPFFFTFTSPSAAAWVPMQSSSAPSTAPHSPKAWPRSLQASPVGLQACAAAPLIDASALD